VRAIGAVARITFVELLLRLCEDVVDNAVEQAGIKRVQDVVEGNTACCLLVDIVGLRALRTSAMNGAT
jgi:hypothetical protein